VEKKSFSLYKLTYTISYKATCSNACKDFTFLFLWLSLKLFDERILNFFQFETPETYIEILIVNPRVIFSYIYLKLLKRMLLFAF